ncbi:hypothetical protein [Maribacter sp.]|uniref:hypothetical protein n=1 Tax=Maribacter sp. TaxID=1897614 RepID=UPI0025C3A0F8|nr:hypothetical protein [Maribacter sp.]
MNATNIFQQKQRLREGNGLRTPDLLNIPQKHHLLFLEIGKSSFVQSFKAKEVEGAILLVVKTVTPETAFTSFNSELQQLFNKVQLTQPIKKTAHNIFEIVIHNY